MNPLRPQVSVVLCTYNCDRHLLQAIDSVLAQTLTDWELLVIDDGSTDATPELIQTLLQKDGDRLTPSPFHNVSPLRYIRQRHQGLAVARNHGMQLARGEAIAFLNPDEWLAPTKLERQWAILQGNSEIGIVHSGWQHMDVDGATRIKVMPWHDCPRLDLADWLQWHPLRLSAMLFRRKWLLQADGFNPRLRGVEEMDVILRLAAMGCQMEWLRQTVGYHRDADTHDADTHDADTHDADTRDAGVTDDRDAGVTGDVLERVRSLSTLIDQLFAQSDLPAEVVRQERQTRFHTWTWMAWELYRNGHPAAMADYLQQAWHYSPQPPVDTIIAWVECFAEFARRWSQPLDTEQLCHSSEWQRLMRWCMDVSSSPRH